MKAKAFFWLKNCSPLPVRQFLCLLLLSATTAAVAPAFQLGVNYSEWLGFPAANGVQIATDGSGAIYFLTSVIPSEFAVSTVTKLAPDGKTILWQNQLDFGASTMAVDPNGGVYLALIRRPTDTAAYIAKLSSTGAGIAWKTSVGFLPQQAQPAMAADAQGRLYYSAQYVINNFITTSAWVIRFNAAGTAADFTTSIMGTPTSIAVDAAGAAYITGTAVSTQGAGTGFLAKVDAAGVPGYYSVLPAGTSDTVAVDGNGNVTLFASGLVQRIDAAGVVAVKTSVPGATVSYALDAAGNAYVSAASNQLYPVKNSLATCGVDRATTLSRYSELVSVIAPDGLLLQTTYLPGGNEIGSPQLAVTAKGTVFIAATAGPAFTPTQTGPFPAGAAGSLFLSNLSSSAANNPTYSLACAGSSASLLADSISPGELITLFGNALGPQQGIQTQATALNGYPTSAAGVQVTLDGVPAPLLWVQDSQINLVAPWALTPGRNTQICVSYNNVKTNCLTMPVVESAPAVFMAEGRYAAALNQDGTYNTAANPAAQGSIVTVYATGLGAITPSQSNGSLIGAPLPGNVLPLGVAANYVIGIPFGNVINQPFEVEYAGPAPTLVAGVSQINFRVASFPSYGAIYLQMGSGTISSPAFSLHIAGQ